MSCSAEALPFRHLISASMLASLHYAAHVLFMVSDSLTVLDLLLALLMRCSGTRLPAKGSHESWQCLA